MKQGTQYYWYHNDHLGTPQMMTTSSGAVVWKAKYTSYGKATVDPGSAVANSLRFAGQYEDAETGLHYNFSRYYDPDLGRYLRNDPFKLSRLFLLIKNKNNKSQVVHDLKKILSMGISSPQLLNTYTYSANMPNYYSDPSGDFVFCLAAALGYTASYAVWMVASDMAITIGTIYLTQQYIETVGTPDPFPVPPRPKDPCEAACDACTKGCGGKIGKAINCTFCVICFLIPGLF